MQDECVGKVAAIDELCRKAHQWKRAAEHYGGTLATDQVGGRGPSFGFSLV